MFPAIDETHDPRLRSWVQDANYHADFPIQNLPLGVFSPPAGEPRGGIAIGDHILDLAALTATGLLAEQAQSACAAAAVPPLNSFLVLGASARQALRRAVSGLLASGAPARPHLLHSAASCTMHLPAAIGDYTDFYAGIHHATNVGRLFRPDVPLPANYRWMPIGYHGRASSIRPSGTPVRRPSGQRKAPEALSPTFGPTRNLDFELELGIWAGRGNSLGDPIRISDSADHIAGFCLLNDWSARDMQRWEYQPLGPFLAKSFATTISCWIVTPEALAPFRSAQAAREPAPLPYLWDEADQKIGALDLTLDVLLETAVMRHSGLLPQPVSRTSAMHLFWTPQQLLTHHASNGCNLRAGDLLGTGTISSPGPEGCGSLLERTRGGTEPIHLPNGQQRTFLEDGDAVILRASAVRKGFATIGFGECRATILPARQL